jgi:hypothetical protein
MDSELLQTLVDDVGRASSPDDLTAMVRLFWAVGVKSPLTLTQTGWEEKFADERFLEDRGLSLRDHLTLLRLWDKLGLLTEEKRLKMAEVVLKRADELVLRDCGYVLSVFGNRNEDVAQVIHRKAGKLIRISPLADGIQYLTALSKHKMRNLKNIASVIDKLCKALTQCPLPVEVVPGHLLKALDALQRLDCVHRAQDLLQLVSEVLRKEHVCIEDRIRIVAAFNLLGMNTSTLITDNNSNKELDRFVEELLTSNSQDCLILPAIRALCPYTNNKSSMVKLILKGMDTCHLKSQPEITHHMLSILSDELMVEMSETELERVKEAIAAAKNRGRTGPEPSIYCNSVLETLKSMSTVCELQETPSFFDFDVTATFYVNQSDFIPEKSTKRVRKSKRCTKRGSSKLRPDL